MTPTQKTDRWSLDDNTSSRKGYCRILLDGMDVGVDVFPFRQGADTIAIKAKAAAIVEVLNAAAQWRRCDAGIGPERLEDAVDALNTDGESEPTI